MTVKQMQHLLGYLGYYSGEADNIYGPMTKEATVRFQRDYSLEADGVFGLLTERKILAVVSGCEVPLAVERDTTGTFWDHIRYWCREEFRCRCGEYHAPYCDGFPAEPDQTLVELVDDIRHDLGAPGHRSSGLRCTQHNTDEGGVWNSRHMSGKALDFMIEGKTALEVYQRALSDPRTSYTYIIGNGPYIHVDVN